MMSNYFLSMKVERMNNQDSICDPSDSNPNPKNDPYYCTLTFCDIWSPVSSLSFCQRKPTAPPPLTEVVVLRSH